MTGKCCTINFNFASFDNVDTKRQMAIFIQNLISLTKGQKSETGNKTLIAHAKALFRCNLKGKGYKWIDIKKGRI